MAGVRCAREWLYKFLVSGSEGELPNGNPNEIISRTCITCGIRSWVSFGPEGKFSGSGSDKHEEECAHKERLKKM